MPLSLSSQLSRRVSLRAGHRRAVGARAEALAQRRKVWEMEAYYIAQALVDYICILAPEKIILGGGVMRQRQLFPLIRSEVRRMMGGYLAAEELNDLDTYIVPESLNGDQGILGSLCLGRCGMGAGTWRPGSVRTWAKQTEKEKHMDEKEKELLETMEQEQADVELPKARIAYVMAIVAILCGGNGIGIVAAGLLWKKTQNLAGAVALVAGFTAAALLIVTVVVLVHKRHVKKNLEQEDEG